MAERRMFTKKITDSDEFTSMPPTAQCLYFHLCMSADDDGFSNKIRIAMFNAHASTDDFNTLVNKQFIIPFESSVVAIKHWKMHNLIKSDRYHKTNHAEEKAQLLLNDNIYTLDTECIQDVSKMDTECIQDVSKMDTECIQDVSKMDTEVRLGKDSIGKDSIDKEYTSEFEALWKLYPRRIEKRRGYKCYLIRLKEYSHEQLLESVKNYSEYCKKKKTEEQYIKHMSTFFSKDEPFKDYIKSEDEHGTDSTDSESSYDYDEETLRTYGLL